MNVVRLDSDIKYSVIYSIDDTRVGSILNREAIDMFGLPYDLIINTNGSLDFSPTWIHASRSTQYKTNMTLYSINDYTMHHISTLGTTNQDHYKTLYIAFIGNYNDNKMNILQLHKAKQIISKLKTYYPSIQISYYSDNTPGASNPGLYFPTKKELGI